MPLNPLGLNRKASLFWTYLSKSHVFCIWVHFEYSTVTGAKSPSWSIYTSKAPCSARIAPSFCRNRVLSRSWHSTRGFDKPSATGYGLCCPPTRHNRQLQACYLTSAPSFILLTVFIFAINNNYLFKQNYAYPCVFVRT